MSELREKVIKIIKDNAINGKCELTNREIRKLAGRYHIGSINHIIKLLSQDKRITKETNYCEGKSGLKRIITI